MSWANLKEPRVRVLFNKKPYVLAYGLSKLIYSYFLLASPVINLLYMKIVFGFTKNRYDFAYSLIRLHSLKLCSFVDKEFAILNTSANNQLECFCVNSVVCFNSVCV